MAAERLHRRGDLQRAAPACLGPQREDTQLGEPTPEAIRKWCGVTEVGTGPDAAAEPVDRVLERLLFRVVGEIQAHGAPPSRLRVCHAERAGAVAFSISWASTTLSVH